MRKRFVVEFEGGEGTRWVCSDEEVAETLRRAAELVVERGTEGTEPAVRVGLVEEPPEAGRIIVPGGVR